MEHRTKVGPSNGSLVMMGGGVLREPEILKRFIALAGGASAPIVIIPTASEADYYGPYAPYIDDFMAAGALQLKVLHTRSRERANSDDFVEAIRQAQGLWFSFGGVAIGEPVGVLVGVGVSAVAVVVGVGIKVGLNVLA